jgi:hypothetical protein
MRCCRKTYTDRLQTHLPIDVVGAAALLPLSVLELTTFDAILEQREGTVIKPTMALGIDMPAAEAEEIIDRLVGVKDCPEFHFEHFDLHC